MKICWDNLEKLIYNPKTGRFYKGTNSYIYMDTCEECGEPYIKNIFQKSNFCSKSCANIKERHHSYGKKFTKIHRKKMSESSSGKKHSKETIEKMKNAQKGEKSYKWDGGYNSHGIPKYDTYAPQLDYAEQVRRNKEDENILEVKCAYCGKWYVSKISNIRGRIDALNGKKRGERRLYCSNECKKECPIYNQNKYPKGHKIATSREVQPELRQMVFERDKYECTHCGSIKSLHCHHVEGIRHDPLESADIDKCITLCKKCHKKVHKKEGCKYIDMQCKENSVG